VCSQSIIWSFITEYKRVVGTDLAYLQLIESESTTYQALKEAQMSNDSGLNQAASALQALIDSGNFRFIRKSAARRVAKSKTATRKAHYSSGQSKNLTHIADQKYRTLLKKVLASPDMTVLQREELDIFCRRNSLDPDTAIAIENDIRNQSSMTPLNWEQEIHYSIKRFLRMHGELSETDRLILFNTYVKKERVHASFLEDVVLQELLKIREKKNNTSIFDKNIMGIGIILGLLVIAVAGLYFRNDFTTPQPIADTNQSPLELSISGSIIEDTIWRAQTTYRLTGPVFVEGKARLTIEPGTRIIGEFGSALIVTRDAQIYARGQSNEPIVFTSAKPAGERQRGDWGGIVLLGNASINQPSGHIEGVDKEDVRGHFGGQVDSDSCGVLEYVRIEFAGFEVFADNELNGLTMGGCGHNTIARHVQVHQAADDGVEMFGGTADLKNIVITGAKDDSLDWDMGWRGRVQFLVIQQHGDAGDNGFEADNWKKNHSAEPRSNPTMYNVTMIGSDNPDSGQRAMNLRRGTSGEFHNFIITGHSKELLDIRDLETATLARQGELKFSHTIAYGIGDNGNNYFSSETGSKDDDGGFKEAIFFSAQENINFGADPLLPLAQKIDSPNFVPSAGSPAEQLFTSPPQEEFWDENVNYAGAVRPGINPESSWLYGWTAYPIN
jgi:hypothetical protein